MGKSRAKKLSRLRGFNNTQTGRIHELVKKQDEPGFIAFLDEEGVVDKGRREEGRAMFHALCEEWKERQAAAKKRREQSGR